MPSNPSVPTQTHEGDRARATRDGFEGTRSDRPWPVRHSRGLVFKSQMASKHWAQKWFGWARRASAKVPPGLRHVAAFVLLETGQEVVERPIRSDVARPPIVPVFAPSASPALSRQAALLR